MKQLNEWIRENFDQIVAVVIITIALFGYYFIKS